MARAQPRPGGGATPGTRVPARCARKGSGKGARDRQVGNRDRGGTRGGWEHRVTSEMGGETGGTGAEE